MKYCRYCNKELLRKAWYGNRKRIETNKRWHERIYCDNICRSKVLKEQTPQENYFYGKHLVPWNKGKKYYGKGWRQSDGKGYIRVYVADKEWEYEHRIVAREKYGELSEIEIVHHLNWDKSDNRPENLIVCSRSEHKRLHMEGTQMFI